MGVVPMVFYGWVSLCALWLELCWRAVGRPDVVGWVRWARGTKVVGGRGAQNASRRGGARRGRAASQGGRVKADPVAKTR